MRVSFNQTTGPNTKNTNGFGYAAQMCKNSLVDLGHEVGWRDSSADVEINFIQPEHWYWSGVDYRIGYVPWESTTLPDGWVEAMNEVDEVWTPSGIVAEWFVDAGVTKPVKIYQHGVEGLWSPIQRGVRNGFDVFHHGAEALRKGSDETFEAFQNVLWEEDATIHFKTVAPNWSVPGSTKMRIHTGKWPIDELVALYHQMNLMVYPSWGEGFGLTPLQAMATGMPVLITEGWAPYEHLLEGHNLIKSELTEVPPGWAAWHPGKMFKPDLDDLEDKLRYQWENRDRLAVEAFELSERVHVEYDWNNLTQEAFAHLV